jgi:hypothetical protein
VTQMSSAWTLVIRIHVAVAVQAIKASAAVGAVLKVQHVVVMSVVRQGGSVLMGSVVSSRALSFHLRVRRRSPPRISGLNVLRGIRPAMAIVVLRVKSAVATECADGRASINDGNDSGLALFVGVGLSQFDGLRSAGPAIRTYR